MADTVAQIAKSDTLCAGCGVCAGICPEAAIHMQLDPVSGMPRPTITPEACTACGLCLRTCPGHDIDFEALTPAPWKAGTFTPLTGYTQAIYAGYATDPTVRRGGASGGLVTACLLHLLERGEIDAALVTRMHPTDPLRTEPFLAHTAEEIRSAQRSIYAPVALGAVLRRLLATDQRVAVVALPCHIAGIRKAAQRLPDLGARLHTVLGLFCSRTPSQHATRELLRSRGVDPATVKHIAYRGSGHPGRMTITLDTGREIHVPHLAPDYWGNRFQHFFMPPRCHLCMDKTAMLADLAFGDNWSPEGHSPEGASVVVVRNPECQELITRLRREGGAQLQEIDTANLITYQALQRKMRIVPRKRHWQRHNAAVPDYHGFGVDGMRPSLWGRVSTWTDFLRVRFTQRSPSRRALARVEVLTRIEKRIGFAAFLATRAFVFGWRELTQLAAAFLPAPLPAITRPDGGKIMMVGGYGTRDIGDEAMPHADRLNLRARLGDDLDILMLSPDPGYTAAFHGERAMADLNELAFVRGTSLRALLINLRACIYTACFRLYLWRARHRPNTTLGLWPHARRVMAELRSSDLLFNVGGGNLNSLVPSEFYKKCLTYLAAERHGVPVIISGQTMGPYTDARGRRTAHACLNHVHMITFRDKATSAARLRDAGVTAPRMLDAADDAITLPPDSPDAARAVLNHDVRADWRDTSASLTVAMNLKASLRLFRERGKTVDIAHQCALFAQLADALVAQHDARILFIPTDYCPGVDDRVLHADIMRRMQHTAQAAAIEGEYADTMLQALIGLCDVAIGARYHFCVFAASQLVPFLGVAGGIYQQTKLKGLADLCGLAPCYTPEDINHTTFDRTWPAVQQLLEQRAAIRDALTGVVPELKQHSLTAVEEAARIVRQRSPSAVH